MCKHSCLPVHDEVEEKTSIKLKKRIRYAFLAIIEIFLIFRNAAVLNTLWKRR